jgi:hypothetical protein
MIHANRTFFDFSIGNELTPSTKRQQDSGTETWADHVFTLPRPHRLVIQVQTQPEHQTLEI